MDPEDEVSSVDRLQDKLYRRGAQSEVHPRRELHKHEAEDIATTWDTADAQDGLTTEQFNNEQYVEEILTKKKTSIGSRIVRAIFVASAFFFVFAFGIAVYYFVGGENQVSCDNVGIIVTGPRSTASGKKLTLDIAIENTNPVSLKDVDLEMRFPEGTRDAEKGSINITTAHEAVGTVEVNERVRTTTSAILFGKEQTETEIKAIVNFGIDDSNASFTCEETYDLLIATAPVSLTVQGLEEVSSGQEVELTVLVNSNSDEIVPDMRVIAEYPYGFEFISASPEPVEGNNVWELGDVAPGIEHTLTVRGVIKGQGTEARTVNFMIGEKDPTDPEEISMVLQKVDHPLLVTSPFLQLDATLDKSTDAQIVANLGEEISGSLHWKNTLASALHDVEIYMVITGAMIDPATVDAGQGFYRSVDNTIMWTPQTFEKLDVLEPGEEGDLSFKFSTKQFAEGTSIRNPGMSIEFSVQARRVSDNVPVSQNLVGQSKRTILFNTDIQFDAYALYAIGPFTNTGPHPPRVNVNTTYTVVLSLENGTNDINTGVVRGELPVNINWMGNVSPTNESVTYNPVTREVVWSVGDVPRGTGYQTDPRVVYFQVSTTPSISQLRDELTLISGIVFQGVDVFTGDVIERKKSTVLTNLTEDPYFKKVWGSVGE